MINQKTELASHEELAKSVEAAKKLIDHIFDVKKKPVNWGSTFVDWGLMNDAMIQIEKGYFEITRARGVK